MKNILTKVHINNYTYLFLLICFLSGYIKNILIIFFICLIHEFGHVVLIKLFGYEINKIELLPFGGITYINKNINSSIYKDIIISFGGVILQLFLYLFLFINHINISNSSYNLFMYYNTVILIFNLLPIIPLDGSKIVNLLLDKFLSFKTSYYINGVISFLFLLLFILINYLFNYDNYFILVFLLYHLILYLKNFKYIFNKFLIERYLYNNPYRKIKYKTSQISDLRKEVYHYFNDSNKVVSEKKKLHDLFDKKTYF